MPAERLRSKRLFPPLGFSNSGFDLAPHSPTGTQTMNQSQFLENFAHWFEPAQITHLAREVGWLVRQGKIEAFEFFVGLVFGQMSALKLTLNAQAGCYTQPVSRQAVDQRYYQRTVEFFH